jgi:hypothetical protein
MKKQYTVDYHGEPEFRATRVYVVNNFSRLAVLIIAELDLMRKQTNVTVEVAHITWNKMITPK